MVEKNNVEVLGNASHSLPAVKKDVILELLKFHGLHAYVLFPFMCNYCYYYYVQNANFLEIIRLRCMMMTQQSSIKDQDVRQKINNYTSQPQYL